MSMSIVDHVREKSNTKGSARTLLLDLALYANDCCGVAWPADATLYHDVNVSRQRIHELKNLLEDSGELVIVERPGFTNLYFVAWQGTPLGGTSQGDGRHDPRCPLRHPIVAAACAHLWAPHQTTPEAGEGSDRPDTPTLQEGSDGPDPQGSEISEGGRQTFLTQKHRRTNAKTPAPPAPLSLAPPDGADAPERGSISPEVMRKFGVRYSVEDWPPRRRAPGEGPGEHGPAGVSG
jgi:hypothetical protein